jgi:hypothetical protein
MLRDLEVPQLILTQQLCRSLHHGRFIRHVERHFFCKELTLTILIVIRVFRLLVIFILAVSGALSTGIRSDQLRL